MRYCVPNCIKQQENARFCRITAKNKAIGATMCRNPAMLRQSGAKPAKLSPITLRKCSWRLFLEKKTHLCAIMASKRWRQRMKSVTKSVRYTTRRLRGWRDILGREQYFVVFVLVFHVKQQFLLLIRQLKPSRYELYKPKKAYKT